MKSLSLRNSGSSGSVVAHSNLMTRVSGGDPQEKIRLDPLGP
jgi:hypothetical protein